MDPTLAATTDSQAKPQNGTLDSALLAFGEKTFKRDSRNRFAEDREWFQFALFYQLKQWLSIKNNRWTQIEINPNKPVPMPVTDHFSKTINANANSLGAQIPEMVANADDSNNQNRMAAEAAEHAFPEMDKESGMDVLNPILAKQTVLWGLGVTKETVDSSYSGGTTQIPDIELESQVVDGQEDVNPVASNVLTFPTGKICTEVPPIMEIYLPRDCRDPNLAKRITHRYRKSQSVAKHMYPDAGALSVDEHREISQFYIESLRSLVMSSTDEGEMVSFTEIWADWDELDDDTQEAIEAEWASLPSAAYAEDGLMKVEAAQQYGIYFIYAGGKVVAKGENPWEDHKCFTFFPWEKDPVSPYNKALSAALVPLQKRLNRTDSLMELSEMTNSVGKWVIPNTQQGTTKITGNPSDIIYWDPLGDGKSKPEFVLPNPYGAAIVQKRAAIIQDFKELGYTEGVQTGDAPPGVGSFRGIAYLGAKAEENIQTQRFLWEQSHRLRKEKLLIMARKVWDEPRKAKVAGFNGRYAMQELTGQDLKGNFGIEVLKDSSKPKTRQEKLTAIQMAAEGMMIDPADPTVRDFTMDALGLNEINASDHYDYVKSYRDLEKLKQGQLPLEIVSTKWDIPILVIGNYMKTEEYEALTPQIQGFISMYFQYLSDKLSAIKQTAGGGPGPGQMAAQLASAIGGNNKSALSGIPGETEKPDQAEKGAASEGDGIVKKLFGGS